MEKNYKLIQEDVKTVTSKVTILLVHLGLLLPQTPVIHNPPSNQQIGKDNSQANSTDPKGGLFEKSRFL